MAIRTRRLTGPGRLSGDDLDVQVHYTLLHRSEDVPADHTGDPPVPSASKDSISGRVELPKGVFVPPGKLMVLTLTTEIK
jgi:hypothetical protein